MNRVKAIDDHDLLTDRLVNYISGRSYAGTFDLGVPIVSMINFKGRVLVATTLCVYELRDKVLVPLEFETVPR